MKYAIGYSKRYPFIAQAHPYPNLDILLRTLDHYFAGLINLKGLEFALKTGRAFNYYTEFAALMLEQLKDCSEASEIMDVFESVFLVETASGAALLEKLRGELSFSLQADVLAPGLLEKILSGTSKVGEPLTRRDMLRVATGMNHVRENHGKQTCSLAVLQLKNLQAMSEQRQEDVCEQIGAGFFINVSEELSGPEKWAAVDCHREDAVQVFCEMPLTGDEKKSLEQVFKWPAVAYEVGGSNNLYVTGYAAVAWLNDDARPELKAWNFDRSADFPSLLLNLLFVMIGGDYDEQTMTFHLSPDEKENVLTASARELVIKTYQFESETKITLTNLVEMARLAVLGRFNGARFQPGDVCEAIKIVGQMDALDDRACKVLESEAATVPGLDKTMRQEQYLQTEGPRSTLNMQQRKLTLIDFDRAHTGAGDLNHFNASAWFKIVGVDEAAFAPSKMAVDSEKRVQQLFQCMLYSFVLTQSQQRSLVFKVPSRLKIPAEVQQDVVRLLEQNAFVTEIDPGRNQHEDICAIQDHVLSVLGRNNLLMLSGYRPAMVDDYWRIAIQHWLVYLSETPDVLLDHASTRPYKKAIHDMGVEGFKYLLGVLRDAGNVDFIESLTRQRLPNFYAACQVPEYPEYVSLLQSHLDEGQSFPFAEFRILYEPESDRDLLDLLDVVAKSINHEVAVCQIERISLDSFLSSIGGERRGFATCQQFLTQLIEQAQVNRWQQPIVIPELESVQAGWGFLEVEELQRAYRFLNDVIVVNRRQFAAVKKCEQLRVVAKPLAIEDVSDDVVDVAGGGGEGAVEDASLAALASRLGLGSSDQTWPLVVDDGQAGVQFQQEQQLQQQFQEQQEQQQVLQRVISQVHKDPLPEVLVGHDNIDELLGDFWLQYQAENRCFEDAACLKGDNESQLQGFFHTWVGAQQVGATHIINQMTERAAQALLKGHMHLAAGLNTDNLPAGFYTQRDKVGNLVLCYDAAYCNDVACTPLTLSLVTPCLVMDAWQGDYRQLDLARHSDGSVLTADWQDILLFVKLQPALSGQEIDSEFAIFIASLNAESRELITANQEKIKSHWQAFKQVWTVYGMDALPTFVDEQELQLDNSIALERLCRGLDERVIVWAKARGFNDHQLRGLGQVYYQYGSPGLALFLEQLWQLELTLGPAFFNVFKSSCLQKVYAYKELMQPAVVQSFARMTDKLQGSEEADKKRVLWMRLLEKQAAINPHIDIHRLWCGFEYFLAELAEMGLPLTGREFDELGAGSENMLICLDRIMDSLKAVYRDEQRVEFLSHLAGMDLTEGGIKYAVCHEGFRNTSNDLRLQAFADGSPTYQPQLTEFYQWDVGHVSLWMLRSLAQMDRFSAEDFQELSVYFSDININKMHQLVLLLATHYEFNSIDNLLQRLHAIDVSYLPILAGHLHRAVFMGGAYARPSVSLDALIHLCKCTEDRKQCKILLDTYRLSDYQTCVALECVTVAHQHGDDLAPYLKLLNSQLTQTHIHKPSYALALKLACLLKGFHHGSVMALANRIAGLKGVVRYQFNLLCHQLLALDYEVSEFRVGSDYFGMLCDCLGAMQVENCAARRIELMQQLREYGLHFRCSQSGEHRLLTDADRAALPQLALFGDHEGRLWQFLKSHIAIPTDKDVYESFAPLFKFLRHLQLANTYLNEIGPLLAVIEHPGHGQVWSIDYLIGLLQTLLPKDDQSAYPITWLKAIMTNEVVRARPIDEIEHYFPDNLARGIAAIKLNPDFTRKQKLMICQVLLSEYQSSERCDKTLAMLIELSQSVFSEAREAVLQMLEQAAGFSAVEARFRDCQWFVGLEIPRPLLECWPEVLSLWFNALLQEEQSSLFLACLKEQLEEKQVFLVQIIAYSSFVQGFRTDDEWRYHRSRKTLKLIERLNQLDMDDLRAMSLLYPGQPSPTSDQLLRMIKAASRSKHPFPVELYDYCCSPNRVKRRDFGEVTVSRLADMQRLIADTCISVGGEKNVLSTAGSIKMTFQLMYLKQLESGQVRLHDGMLSISDLNPEQLKEQFLRLSVALRINPDDEQWQVQLWAVLFEVIGRTTSKYPHLAQQYALLACESGEAAEHLVLQMATGEGKSHFSTLRAAFHVALGRTVNNYTAKRFLAKRDRAEYISFFGYLGIKTAYIHPKSERSEYHNAPVRFSTVGDFTLFSAAQSYRGKPVCVKNCVALVDEFDFLLFDEAYKTEYNYAELLGYKPKQMEWLYLAILTYYQQIRLFLDQTIDESHIADLFNYLAERAGSSEERQIMLQRFVKNKLQLVQWIRSAHQAVHLRFGSDFTVREVLIATGEGETRPMREVVPLSSAMQPMMGSTFSNFVGELTATLLRMQAREGEPRNYHAHPPSRIVGSWVASSVLDRHARTESFSGTVSPAQAYQLHEKNGTRVIHMPTNQRDLREWAAPSFYDSEEARLDATIKELVACIDDGESVLFCSRDDRGVSKLEKALRGKLDPQWVERHLMFHTNEDARDAEAVLAEKKKKEARVGGKKTGVCLVASAFSRGDNCEVDAVFLHHANDQNDRLQKGGRTGRNGKPGRVYQFYVLEELQHEYMMLTRQAQRLSNSTMWRESLGKIAETNAGLLKKVLLLREYVASLRNIPIQAYREVRSQLSDWAADVISQKEDLSEREQVMHTFSRLLVDMERNWFLILADKDLTVDEKINQLREVADSIVSEYPVFQKESMYQTKTYQKPAIVIAPDTIALRSPVAHATEQATISLMRLQSKAGGFSLSEMAMIQEQMRRLSDNDAAWIEFSLHAVRAATPAEFIKALQIACLALEQGSGQYDAVRLFRQQALGESAFVSLDNYHALQQRLASMAPVLREDLLRLLKADCVYLGDKLQTRVDRLLPIINFLAAFPTVHDQLEWGPAYVANIPRLLNQVGDDLLVILATELESCDFDTFAFIATNVQQWCDSGDVVTVAQLTQAALKARGEQGKRAFKAWENLVVDLHPADQKDFYLDFCQVMAACHEPEMQAVFVLLLQRTQRSWRTHSVKVRELWRQLAQWHSQLSDVKALLIFNFGVANKNWHLSSLQALTSLEPCQIAGFVELIDLVKNNPEHQALGQKEQLRRDQILYQAIDVLYHYFDGLTQDRDAFLVTICQLPYDKVCYLLQLFFNRASELSENQLLERMLAYAEEPEITFGDLYTFERLSNFFEDNYASLYRFVPLVADELDEPGVDEGQVLRCFARLVQVGPSRAFAAMGNVEKRHYLLGLCANEGVNVRLLRVLIAFSACDNVPVENLPMLKEMGTSFKAWKFSTYEQRDVLARAIIAASAGPASELAIQTELFQDRAVQCLVDTAAAYVVSLDSVREVTLAKQVIRKFYRFLNRSPRSIDQLLRALDSQEQVILQKLLRAEVFVVQGTCNDPFVVFDKPMNDDLLGNLTQRVQEEVRQALVEASEARLTAGQLSMLAQIAFRQRGSRTAVTIQGGAKLADINDLREGFLQQLRGYARKHKSRNRRGRFVDQLMNTLEDENVTFIALLSQLNHVRRSALQADHTYNMSHVAKVNSSSSRFYQLLGRMEKQVMCGWLEQQATWSASELSQYEGLIKEQYEDGLERLMTELGAYLSSCRGEEGASYYNGFQCFFKRMLPRALQQQKSALYAALGEELSETGLEALIYYLRECQSHMPRHMKVMIEELLPLAAARRALLHCEVNFAETSWVSAVAAN